MYSREVDGEVYEFGTSGLLYRSNKLMYDRTTHTLWRQFLGDPVVGRLADSGLKLEIIPVLVTTWSEWVAAHPNTTVLDIDTGIYSADSKSYRPEGDPDSAYFDYRHSPYTLFPVWLRSDDLLTKEQVLGIDVDGQSKAYPLAALIKEPVINDSLGGQNLVVVTEAGFNGARVYERGTHEFALAQDIEVQEGAIILTDERNRSWRVEEESLVLNQEPIDRLKRLPSHMSYWFGWYQFHPDTDIYGQSESGP